MTSTLHAPSPSMSSLQADFWSQVSSVPDGDKIKQCLQCGTCTGSCPVSGFMDVTPRKAIAMFRAGMIEDLLRSRTIWICASCYSCTVRCPVGIKVTDTMYALKRVAMNRGIFPVDFPAHIMSAAFMSNVYKYGRNYELGLGIKYYMRSNFVKLFTSAGYGLSLIRQKRMALIPTKIRRVREVQAIIKKAAEYGESL